MANEITLILAERQYTVKPLPIKASKLWRQRLGGPLSEVVGVLSNADKIRLDTPAGLGGLLEVVQERLLNSPDLVLDMVCEYAPEIKRDREYIEENGYDEEVMGAFVELVKLAYPFGGLLRALQRIG